MTSRQKLFVAEYLVDLNASRAAIAAGYSTNGADGTGSRLLVNIKVAEQISKRLLRGLPAIKLQMAARMIVEENPADAEIAAFMGLKPRALRFLKTVPSFAKRIERERSILSLEESFRPALARLARKD